ncbi:MAG: 30S ribosomal protein S6 [Candidatus Moranbacteria bacterium]|nr:30S ribosomal protein S6 [Candidatus Moranbacteria bacterium]
MQYELFYLVGERQEATLDAIREGVSAMLVSEGAKLLEPELTEKRKLSYEIKHQNKGTYVTRRFELEEIDFWADEKNSEKEFGIAAMTNKLNLNNDVLRFLIVKTEDLPELGAKERRKAQEMKTQRPETIRPQRPERRETPRQFTKPAPAPVATTPVASKEVSEQPKQEVVAEKEIVKEVVTKETTKDIDKQLDELLNI